MALGHVREHTGFRCQKCGQSIIIEDGEYTCGCPEQCCLCTGPAEIWIEDNPYCEFHSTIRNRIIRRIMMAISYENKDDAIKAMVEDFKAVRKIANKWYNFLKPQCLNFLCFISTKNIENLVKAIVNNTPIHKDINSFYYNKVNFNSEITGECTKTIIHIAPIYRGCFNKNFYKTPVICWVIDHVKKTIKRDMHKPYSCLDFLNGK